MKKTAEKKKVPKQTKKKSERKNSLRSSKSTRKSEDNKPPLVSILMAVYNCEKYVAQAIESILGQTFSDFEFLIMDDCSNDSSAKVIEKYAKKDSRIVFTRNKKNLRLAKNLNIGLKNARGKFIARIDADDIAELDRLRKQVEFLQNNPDIYLVGTQANIINNQNEVIGEIIYPTDHDTIRKNHFARNQFIHPSVMFRKEVIKKAGLYDPTFRVAQDFDFFARVVSQYKVANLPEKLLRYRWDFTQNDGFTTGNLQFKNGLRTQWRMITQYGWPWWNVFRMWRMLLSYLVPAKIKHRILKAIRS